MITLVYNILTFKLQVLLFVSSNFRTFDKQAYEWSERWVALPTNEKDIENSMINRAIKETNK